MPPVFNFQPYTTFYKPQNAYWLARASQLAYARKAEDNPAPDGEMILRELKSWHPGFSEVHTFNNKSSQAFIAKNDGGGSLGYPGFVIIAFRGTDENADWADNLNVFSVDFPKGRGLAPLGQVHSGFYNAFLDVWDNKGPEDQFTMQEILARDDYRKKPFWITGHSLGGAMASMCSFQFTYDDIPFYGTYTYGQPRACKRSLRRHFNAEAKGRYFRFQNNNDVVSRVPQRAAGYTHIGTFIYIDNDQDLTVDAGAWFMFEDRVDGLKEFTREKAAGGFFRDHDISEYIEAIEKNIDEMPKGLS